MGVGGDGEKENHLGSYLENLVVIRVDILPGSVFPGDAKLSAVLVYPAEPLVVFTVDLLNQPPGKP